MPRVPVGQPVSVSIDVADPATGAPADPGDISVYLTNTTTGVPTTYDYPGQIVRDSVGRFHLILAGLPAALHQGYWETTGAFSGRKPIVLHVVDALAPSHLSIEDARARLNKTVTDAEIEDMIASAVSEQERKVGAIAPRTVTETVTARNGRLWLNTRPVLSVTSATLGGVGQDVSGWVQSYGIITSPSVWLSGAYTVTYRAGRAPVPQDLVEAGLLRVQHSYETQRGSSADTAFTDVTEGGGSAFLLMLRARDKEAPYVLPVVA